MKRLLAFLLLCLPLYLFAQGFGSFSHDQPFFAKDRAVDSINFATNLLFRWVYTNLPNGQFLSWTDQVSSRVLGVYTNGRAPMTNFNNGVPTNTSNGIKFVPNASCSLTNGTDLNIVGGPPPENWAQGFIIKPILENGSSRYTLYLTNHLETRSPEARFYNTPNPDYLESLAGANLGYIITNIWYDILITGTNFSGAGWTQVYTNGVLSFNLTGKLLRPFGSIGLPASGAIGFDGLIKEIWFRTNLLTSQIELQAMADDLHYTRTNLYGQ